MFAGFGAAEDTNARFRQLLEAGQTGLSIAYDMPTLYGYDTDDPEAEGEFGTCGVAVSSLADMEVLLDGLPLDEVSTSMTINSPAAPIWAMYIAAAEKRGVPRTALEGTTQNDILKEFVAQKEFLFPPEPSMRLVTDTIEFGTRELPRWNTISISGYHIREAGSTAVQELAFTIADGMAYVEAALQRGLRIDDFAPRLSFFFNSHSDFFEEIAKFRASRRIWYRLMTRALPRRERAIDLDALPYPDGRREPDRPAAAQQPDPGRPPGPGGRARRDTVAPHRRVRRGVGRALGRGRPPRPAPAADHRRGDPGSRAPSTRSAARGSSSRSPTRRNAPSGATSTRSTGAAAWSRPSARATRSARSPTRRTGSSASSMSGERAIVGVNRYADPDEELAIPLLTVSEGSERAQRSRLERTRRERDGTAVAAALAGLRDAARRPGTSDTNLMPHFLRCANAYATLGEQCAVLREVFGEYREPVAV